jgi:hypothetical protein
MGTPLQVWVAGYVCGALTTSPTQTPSVQVVRADQDTGQIIVTAHGAFFAIDVTPLDSAPPRV